MPELTPKQEAFAQAYVETSNASEAYRRVYAKPGSKAETIGAAACKTLAHEGVAARVIELQDQARQRHAVTMDSLTAELDAARALAMKDEKGASAAVAAVMGKAKLHGFLVDKVKQTIEGQIDLKADIDPIQRAKAVSMVLVRALHEMKQKQDAGEDIGEAGRFVKNFYDVLSEANERSNAA